MNATSTIFEKAKRARSIKGSPIPQNLLDKLVKLETENPTYRFIVGSASTLSRKLAFFKQNHLELNFYDSNGEEFEFSVSASVVSNNEPFMGINFGEDTQEAYIYMYFPHDGALR